MKTNIALIALAASALTAMVGCTVASASKAIEPQDSVAIFHHFDYEGNDEYYNAHPLADQSSFYNPILPGWYSDPSVCTNGEGDYFLATSTFSYFPGVPLFHSRDMVNWKQVGHILNRPSQLQNLEKQHVSGGIFAPAIEYNPANKTYYMITTNVGAGNFFVKTKNPFGEWSDPIMLPEVQGIDPSFFFDEDGRAYIVNNDDAPDAKPEYPGHRTIRVVEFDTATDRCIGERKIVVNKGVRPDEKPIWCEGPHLYKIHDRYYLMTAEGGTSTGHSEVIYRGPSPFGPFTAWEGNPILTQRTLAAGRPDAVTCAGHADIIQTKEGDWWGVFLACRPVSGDDENLGRETFMLPVKWTDDEWPYFISEGEAVALQSRREGVKRSEDVTFGNFARHEAFTDSVLGLEWLTLRGPALNHYSLKRNPGFLTLNCSPVATTEKAPIPYVCRRINHHIYKADTRMTFSPSKKGQSAGMMILKDETHQFQFGKSVREDGTHAITVRRIGENGFDELGAAEIAPSLHTVDLRTESDGHTLSFSFSADGGKTWQNVARGVDASYTSTAKAGGFTGTTIGMYATSENSKPIHL